MKFRSMALKGLAVSVSGVALAITAPAIAQDTAPVDCNNLPQGAAIPAECQATVASVDGTVGESGGIVVTGSRIQRTDTYTSVSPLQVLETEASNDVGEFDASTILQRSESAAGTQIDASFNGFVLNNGPNSQTLDLRGLGADRTLLLINGRRMAPAGVEGAPSNPSINLLPSSLIARYDLLLDGASSVYGSDAVAGVGNIVLRKDLDGFEFFTSGNYNPQGGGRDWTVSGAWGKRGDNWQLGVGAEYARRGQILLRDREALAGCDRHFEITDTGEIRNLDVYTQANTLNLSQGRITTSTGECKLNSFVRRFQASGTYFGSVYYDPTVYAATGTQGNTGIPGFSETDNAFGLPVDRNGDGLRDVDFFKYEANNEEQDVVYISPQNLYNVMAYGELELGGITPFFEANYSRAEVSVSNSGTGQLFPWVPATNAFSPCNISSVNGVRINPNGVDCRAANNTFEGFGVGNPNRLGQGTSVATRPIISVRGDRNNVETVQEVYRGVIGLKGDLEFINFGAGNDWTFEIAGVYNHSKGTSVRRGVRGDKLAFALGIDPTADYTGNLTPDDNKDGVADQYDYNLTAPPLTNGACNAAGLRNPTFAMPDLTAGCVPVNLFAPSLYTSAIGDFGTQAERDYLFGERRVDTTYDQTLLSAYIQGSVFELQGGTAKAVLGGEYRIDKIKTESDAVARNGLLWGFFSDLGTNGSKDTYEVFGELDLPLVSNQPMADMVSLNLSGRATHDEIYGWNETYSIKFGWRPIRQLMLKLSQGTSFRAPNLRENFLGGISGFSTITDPCSVPTAAFQAVAGNGRPAGYQADRDTRDPIVIANCIREGRDPTRVGIQPGLNTITTASVQSFRTGSLDLEPETSTSFTTGAAFGDRWGDFRLNLNFNYYNIRISNAIAQLSAAFVVNECYFQSSASFRSPYCDDLRYQTDPAGRLQINSLDRGFVNINRERVRGMDFNANFGYDARMFNEDVRLDLNLRANHLLNRTTFLDAGAGTTTDDEEAGDFGYPSWTGRATFTAAVKNFTFTWQTRWIDDVTQDPEFVDLFSDALNSKRVVPNTISDTCTGLGNAFVPADNVQCRDIGFAKDYFTSSASVRYSTDLFEVRVGVSNIFDKKPPQVDSSEVTAIGNTPIGNGYDVDGREFFGSLKIKF